MMSELKEEVAALKRIADFHRTEQKEHSLFPTPQETGLKYLFLYPNPGGGYSLAENYIYARRWATIHDISVVHFEDVFMIDPPMKDRRLIGPEFLKDITPSSFRVIYSISKYLAAKFPTYNMMDLNETERSFILKYGNIVV